MTDITLCIPGSGCEKRKTCFRYLAVPNELSGQSYCDFDTGMGIRCEHRIDVMDSSRPARCWGDVDAEIVRNRGVALSELAKLDGAML